MRDRGVLTCAQVPPQDTACGSQSPSAPPQYGTCMGRESVRGRWVHGAGAGSPPGLHSREEAPVLSWLSCHNQPILASLPELMQQHRPWLLVGQAGQELAESPVRAQQESGHWLRWPQVYTKQGWVDAACTNVSSSDHPHPRPQKPPPSPRGRILLVPGLRCFQVAGREHSTEKHQHLLGQGDLCCHMATVPCGHPGQATGTHQRGGYSPPAAW